MGCRLGDGRRARRPLPPGVNSHMENTMKKAYQTRSGEPTPPRKVPPDHPCLLAPKPVRLLLSEPQLCGHRETYRDAEPGSQYRPKVWRDSAKHSGKGPGAVTRGILSGMRPGRYRHLSIPEQAALALVADIDPWRMVLDVIASPLKFLPSTACGEYRGNLRITEYAQLGQALSEDADGTERFMLIFSDDQGWLYDLHPKDHPVDVQGVAQ